MFDKLVKDEFIIKNYLKVNEYEKDNENSYAYHDLNHVLKVAEMVEVILTSLGYEKELVDDAKVAALFHDIACFEGKDNHAYKSYLMAKDFFEEKNINLNNKEMVLEAIKNHSSGFDTENIITLALIFSDKIDVTEKRVTKKGLNFIGNRQYANIKDVSIEISNGNLKVIFITNSNFDKKEAEEYYFTSKIFKAIKAFASKVDLNYEVILNEENWRF